MSNITSSIGSLTGGLPTVSQDMAPTIIFLILYILTTALCIYRLTIQYRRPTRLFITFVRFPLFELARVATFIMRALLAENFTKVLKGQASINKNLIIGEQILLGIGFLIPASVLVRLAGFHGSRFEGGDILGGRRRATWFLEIMLIVAIAFGIIAGTNFSGALTDPSKAKDVKHDRVISSAITLAVLVILVFYCISLASRPNFPRATSLWLGLTSALLIIVPAYRIHNTLNPPASADSAASKAEFYILQITVEWLVGASILAVNVKEWCGIQDTSYLDPADVQTQKVYLMQPV